MTDRLRDSIAARLAGWRLTRLGREIVITADEADTLAVVACSAIRDDQTVRTVEEMEALPVGTIILGWNGHLAVRVNDREDGLPWEVQSESHPRQPATRVLYRPDQEVGGA